MLLYVCSKMKSYYFSIYSGYNMLNGRKSVSANEKKLTWIYFKVTMYNTLESHKTFSYIYRTFCRISYLNYDITCTIVLKF